MSIKKLMLTVICILASMVCLADETEGKKPFNGVVTDLFGTPVKGAKIWVVRKLESTSDKEGKFGLTNVNTSDTLHVRYKKKVYDIPVNGRKSVRIKLGDMIEAEEDEEMCNQGYGWVKKREKLVPSSGVPGEVLLSEVSLPSMQAPNRSISSTECK